MSGPCLTSNLVGVLTRFRKEQVALIGDIQAIFHQIKVDPRHRNALRFLWWPGGNLDLDPVDHQMQVHLFGATSSPSCASYCLRRVVVDFGNQHLPIVSQIVKNNFYVDDCLMSFSSAIKAIEVMKDLTQMLEKGGFHLTKWLTNNHELLAALPKADKAKQLQPRDIDTPPAHRVLGVQWNFEEDAFIFNVSLRNKPLTRRGLLATVSSLFDPLGFVAPVTLFPKLLLQELCRKGRDWDQTLEDEEANRWNKWMLTLSSLNQLRIQRCFKPPEFGDSVRQELHLFSDASLYCYGSCCYLRLLNSEGQIHCVFIMGKARVAPMKAVSIPKLELTAAVLSVRLCQLVKRELDLSNCKTTFWTDSTSVLQIIHNDIKRFPIFVANRVAVIDEHTCIEEWKYIPTKLNPADFASRGICANQLSDSHPWLKGPCFLWSSEDLWPEPPNELPEVPSDLIKARSHKASFLAIKSCLQNQNDANFFDRLINRSSTLIKVKRLTAWLIRTKQFLHNKVKNKDAKFNSEPLSFNELKLAELEIVKYV